MDLAGLLRDPPPLHRTADGRPVPWRVDEQLLRQVARLAADAGRTLETGAGLSTLVFAMSGARHTAVVPDEALVRRVRDWCAEHGVSDSKLEFEIGPSQAVLPRLPDEPLDLVLIDGEHGFPAPFIDWYYAGRRVKEGGHLVVDDAHIWTGRVLRDFLRGDDQWSIVHEDWMGFFIARRVSVGRMGGWRDQPYVARRSFAQASPSRLRRLVGTAARHLRHLRRGAALIRRGEIGELRRQIRRVRG
jgi:predicted O-methyltransferase YrrM